MKNLLFIGALILSVNTFASDKGNGGDICESKMRKISTDIETWLLSDNYKGIKLPAQLSEEEYKDGMLDAVKKSLLSCTSEKVFIGGSEKTCKNFEDEKGETRIQCNFDRFMKTEGKEQYRLMHHEFAGVAGFEINNGEEASTYRISNQISDFLKEEVEYKLGIKSESNQVFKDFGLKYLPEGTTIEFTKNFKFGVGQTVVFGESDKYYRYASVVFKKDSQQERIVKPRKCQLKKVKSPFANLYFNYQLILSGDAVCESLVIEYYAAGFAMFYDASYAATDLGIKFILPKAIEQ